MYGMGADFAAAALDQPLFDFVNLLESTTRAAPASRTALSSGCDGASWLHRCLRPLDRDRRRRARVTLADTRCRSDACFPAVFYRREPLPLEPLPARAHATAPRPRRRRRSHLPG